MITRKCSICGDIFEIEQTLGSMFDEDGLDSFVICKGCNEKIVKSNKSNSIQESYRVTAHNHWKWVKECLVFFGSPFADTHLLESMEWAYVNGFMHGAKHGSEDNDKKAKRKGLGGMK